MAEDEKHQEPNPIRSQLPSSLSQKLVSEAVQSGINQADLLMEIMGNIIAKRLEDGFQSGVFHDRISARLKNFFSQQLVRYFPQENGLTGLKQIELPELNDEDDLTRFIDNLIIARLQLKVQEEEKFVKVEEKKQKLLLQAEKRKKREQREKIDRFNNWFMISVITVSLFGLGVLVGINLLPNGVVCPASHSPCYWLRFDGQKITVD